MASVEECREALARLSSRMAANAAEVRSKVELDRSLACRLKDLGAAFHGRLKDGQLLDITDGDDPRAKIALTLSSDDLIDLVGGRLSLAHAVASGRARLSANPFDLLKLRKLL